MENDQNRKRVISRKGNGYIIYEVNGLMIGSQGKKGGFDVKANIKAKNKD
jgi:hypothetical protein